MKRVLDLYSGIAGMHLASLIAGDYETVAFSEIDPLACAVLAHHYPHIPNFGDCHAITEEVIAILKATRGPIHVVAAGFPCQGNSFAGKRKGRDDLRNLWPETARILRLSGAEWFVGENVRGLLSANVDPRKRDHGLFGDIQRDLARMGFASGWSVISAADAGAPHQRDRIAIIAHRDPRRVRYALAFLADAISGQRAWGPQLPTRWDEISGGRNVWANTDRRRDTVADPHERGQHPGPQRDARWETGATPALRCGERGAMAHDDGGDRQTRSTCPVRREAGEIAGVCSRERGEMGHTDGEQCHRGTDCQGDIANGTAPEWNEGDSQPESTGERSVIVAHTRYTESPGRVASSEGCTGTACNVAASRDGVGVGLADSNEARLSERDGRTGTSRACTTTNECGAGPTQPRLGDATHGLPRWMVGRWPAGPGQAQHEWEAPRTVTAKVPGRASKLKALGNAIVPLQFAPVFASINAVEAAFSESEVA